MTIARSATDDVFDGATAVLGARSVPPIVVTQTIGTGRFNRQRNAIEIDPKVLTWPVECRRFLGAHEAAHAVQAELPRRWALIVLAVVMIGYLAFVSAAAIKFGFGDDSLQLAIEATFYTGMILLVLIETVLYQCRRLEYQADHAAAAAVGTAGIIQWQHIAQAELSQTTRTMLAINAATGLRTHPTWRRRISAVTDESTKKPYGGRPDRGGGLPGRPGTHLNEPVAASSHATVVDPSNGRTSPAVNPVRRHPHVHRRRPAA